VTSSHLPLSTEKKKASVERWVDYVPEPLRGAKGEYTSKYHASGVLVRADYELMTERWKRVLTNCVVRSLMGVEGRRRGAEEREKGEGEEATMLERV
jgi:hypothetical protein